MRVRESERFISAASGVTDETTKSSAERPRRQKRDITYLIQLEWTSKEKRTMMMTVMKEEEEFIVILRIKAEDSLSNGWD